MNYGLHVLENAFWQVGILAETGASIAFGRVRAGGQWVDFLRPTPESEYGNVSKCASFVMLPWSNRIRDGRFRFNGIDYQLQVNNRDGTAIHGDVRRRPWRVDSADGTHTGLSIRSADHENVNFPFRFSGRAVYRLDGRDLVMELALKNEDTQPMPGGFGQHPYFVNAKGVQLELPFALEYELVNAMPTKLPVPIRPEVDFRTLRPLGDTNLDNLISGRQGDAPARLVYPTFSASLRSDPIFQHMVIYTPPDKESYAVEPVTNINDGFNLYAQGMPNTGVFILAPGEEKSGVIQLTLD